MIAVAKKAPVGRSPRHAGSDAAKVLAKGWAGGPSSGYRTRNPQALGAAQRNADRVGFNPETASEFGDTAFEFFDAGADIRVARVGSGDRQGGVAAAHRGVPPADARDDGEEDEAEAIVIALGVYVDAMGVVDAEG